MLTEDERRVVYEHAYVPEHLPDYVTSISAAEPFLDGGYLYYIRESHLIFVGYPLGETRRDAVEAYEAACRRFRSVTAAVMGPRLWFKDARVEQHAEDRYFRLELPLARLEQSVAYMVRRAAREVRVSPGRFGSEQENLVRAFTEGRGLGPGHEEILAHIGSYLESSGSARLLDARRGDELAAFAVADLGSAHYAFYLFSVRSLTNPVPGVSDLLFHEVAELALAAGKRSLNMGLGINSGVQRFKEKWGAAAFLRYESALVRRKRPSLLSALMRS